MPYDASRRKAVRAGDDADYGEKTHMSEELSSEVAAEEVGNAADGAARQRPAEERKWIVTNLQQFAVVLEGEASTLTSALSIRLVSSSTRGCCLPGCLLGHAVI
jgi:hypothetical protein